MKNDTVTMLGGSMIEMGLPLSQSIAQAIDGQLAIDRSGNVVRYDGTANSWAISAQIGAALGYDFTEHLFTTNALTGAVPPTLEQLRVAYSATTWVTNDSLFNVEDGIQYWTVPKSGRYAIEAKGAGNSSVARGARVYGEVNLVAGDRLRMIVGQRGTSFNGCGATCVSDGRGLIMIAGGAGANRNSTGSDANASLTAPGTGMGGKAHTYGSSGSATAVTAGGGAGWLGAGALPNFPLTFVAGDALIDGGNGNSGTPSLKGGWGGGGSGGSGSNSTGCGGGGGYTGGGAATGYAIGGATAAARGGTSYVDAARVTAANSALAQHPHGSVLVRLLEEA